MTEVTIVGGGMAGLSAALRLAERGFDVTLFEQARHVGGQFGVIETEDGALHEHCYHMFLNWYNNFWDIVDELGVRSSFVPHPSIQFLERGQWPETTKLTNVGSAKTSLQNLTSGVLPFPDMFIYGYSLIDLLAQPFNRDHYRDQYSVNGFMASRLYATDRAAQEFQRSLAKAFACPPYRTSALSYKTFLKYGFRYPDPMMWVLEGDCYNYFLKPLVARLTELGCKLKLACEVKAIALSDDGIATGLTYQQVPGSDLPDQEDPEPPGAGPDIQHEFDYLIMAVPPDRLGEFVDERVYDVAPEMGQVRQLHGEPIASLDLYFNKKIEGIPSDHVVITDSEYELSFIDNSQLWKEWPNQPHTYLNLVASNFDVLAPMADVDPDYAKRKIIDDLLLAMPAFTYDDIDFDASFLNTNVGEHIFINEVGSWSHRPEAVTQIPNLFLAGDYCRSFVDITTIEGAVVTGLTAAEALRKRAEQGAGQPIKITEPDYYPEAALTALKLMYKPYAFAAKAWSMADDTAYGRFARQFVERAVSRGL